METVAVIIPAAGAGKRFGGTENKVLQPMKERPVFLRTLDLFATREDVCQVLLCVAPAGREALAGRFGAELDRMAVQLVDGGAARTDSVRNALAAVDAKAGLICVHDAVRPCVPVSCIDAVFAQAAASGAAILAVPIHGTVKKADAENVIEQTVDRTGLWEAQPPQVFRADMLRQAYATPAPATDDAHLVQAAGFPVRLVAGDVRNVKITTGGDLAFAEAVFDSLTD